MRDTVQMKHPTMGNPRSGLALVVGRRPAPGAAARPDTRRRTPIDSLVEWTFRVQKADRASAGLEHRTWYAGVSCTALICDTLALQTQVDNGGPGHRIPPDVHPDAERVHELVQRMPMDQRILIEEQARIGGAPSWCDGVFPLPVARRDLRGRPVIQWLDPDGNPAVYARHNYGVCEIEYEPSWAFIDATRDVYTAWRQALLALLERLGDSRELRDHVAVAPVAKPTPWLASADY